MEENPDNKEVKKDEIKIPKGYTSISTRLQNIDTVRFILHCKRLNTTTSERLRQLALSDISNPKRQIISGKNIIKYDKLNNSFRWFIHPDKGEETEVISRLSLDFLKSLEQSIQEAIKERNEWVHHSQNGSVEVPTELIGGEK